MAPVKNLLLFGGRIGTDDEITENFKSIGEFLLRKLELADNKEILVDAVTEHTLTAADARHNAIQLAITLKEKFGIKSDDKISVCSENRFEFVTTWHAILALGCTMAPLNVTYSERELHHAFNLSKPKLIFVSPLYFDKVNKVSKQNSFIDKLIVFDDERTDPAIFTQNSNVHSYQGLLSVDVLKINNFKCEPQKMRQNVSLILCSSGTTGLPKGVQLTQFNLLVANVQHYNRPCDAESAYNDERIVLGILPWFHAFGITIMTILTVRTTKIVFLPKFEEKLFLNSIQKYRANTIYLAPPVMVLLAKSPLLNQYDLSSLKVIWCGAAPLSKELQENVKNRIGVKIIRQGYGMTEGTLAFCAQNDDKHTIGSVGVLRKGVFGRVVDIESNQSLGPNKLGEIQLKGECVMKGYIGDKQATSATVDNLGWLHTGDIGYFDENEEWFIVDRIKELIKYKGYQVPPAEIEGILLRNPKIQDAAVIGIPDDAAGEVPVAFIVKQPNVELTEKEVCDYVAAQVSHPKRLHGGVKFITEIPKNASGKILRRELRELLETKSSKL